MLINSKQKSFNTIGAKCSFNFNSEKDGYHSDVDVWETLHSAA